MDLNTKSSTKPISYKKPSNFAEALLELGGNHRPLGEKQISPDQGSGHIEHDWRNSQLHMERHREITQTQVFNRENEEIEKKIKEVQEELKKLSQELAILGTEIDKAIHEAVVNPGTYHIGFFESLRRYLIQLRKTTTESKNWHAISQERKAAQNHYWGSVKKSGTSFMLSSERTLATQSG